QRVQTSFSTSASFGFPEGPAVRARSTSLAPASTGTAIDAVHAFASANAGAKVTVTPDAVDVPSAPTAATRATTVGSAGSTLPRSVHSEMAVAGHFAKRASAR